MWSASYSGPGSKRAGHCTTNYRWKDVCFKYMRRNDEVETEVVIQRPSLLDHIQDERDQQEDAIIQDKIRKATAAAEADYEPELSGVVPGVLLLKKNLPLSQRIL